MPGILGFISRDQSQDRPARLNRMLTAMLHEPFYSSGTLIQDQFGLAAGWAVHQGSFADCLPVWNETGDICLLFSGEHFTDPRESARIQGRHQCRTDDASWLVHLYEETGPRFWEKLNGVFSGLLVDRRAGKAILFNDRFGLGRIYYHENPEGFYFASEAKSLLEALPQLRQLDQESFAEFYTCGCALQDRSLFTGVRLLPPASKWTFTPDQKVRKETYFKKDVWENQPPLPASDYYEKLNETFGRVLPWYLGGRQQVGLSLTGGLDSRMIIACASPRPATLPCHTFGGMYRECADVALSKRIAKASQQPHEIIAVTQEMFREFPLLAERSVYYSDGAMDVTGAIELFANRVARELAPVRLTGNYGSEVLRGNVTLKASPVRKTMFAPAFVPCLEGAVARYAQERRGARTAFIISKQVPWYHYARLAVEQSQVTVRSPYLENDLVGLAYQAPAEAAVNKDLAFRFIADHSQSLAAIPTDRGVACRPGAPGGKFSVFCQEFMPRAEYVYDYGMPQWLAKLDCWLAPLHVERLFLGRQKFYHFRVWYRDQLAKYVQDVLLDPRTLSRPYLDGGEVSRMVTAHVKGCGNYTVEIHKLLTSELIQRRLLGRN